MDKILLFVFGTYALMMIFLMIGFLLSISKKRKNKKKKQSFSILIPIFNEEKNLPNLITHLSQIDYPKTDFEVIFINDCSKDKSFEWLEEQEDYFEFKHAIINLHKKVGKKTALEKAWTLANFENIVTTDADCIMKPDWLKVINRQKSDLSIGIVLKKSNSLSFLHKFQEVESMMLAGITIGSGALKTPILSSGANLSYSKKMAKFLRPYKDNKTMVSGDDMFMLNTMRNANQKITIRPENSVSTTVKKTWNSYFEQTARWSSKTLPGKRVKKLRIKGLSFVAFTTLLSNVLWLFTFALYFITFDNIFIYLALIKPLVDFLFLFLTSLYYKRLILFIFAPMVAITYPLYLLILGVKVMTYKENWSAND